MGVRIILGYAQGSDEEFILPTHAVLYCSVTGIACGPIFEALEQLASGENAVAWGDDAESVAEGFLEWLEETGRGDIRKREAPNKDADDYLTQVIDGGWHPKETRDEEAAP